MQQAQQLDEQREARGGNVVFGAFVVAWIATIVVYLTHSIVLSSDSINNHIHVWWIARELWHHGHLPWTFPQLGHGHAYAYPYGFLNWTTAALIWPLFGDWAVTLWTAVGVMGCIVASFVAFPETRHGWWAASVLANSALIEALLFGQQSFAWGAMCLLFGMALWRRGQRGWASVLVGIGQATHPVVVAPIALVVVLLYLPYTQARGAVVRWYALSCVLAIPAVIVVFSSPSYADSHPSSQIVNFFSTVGTRILLVVLPWFYALLRRVGWAWLAPASLIVPLGFNIGFQYPLNVGAQQKALTHHGANTATLDAYLHSPSFVRGATYRVLRGGDGKLGLYHVVRAGGNIDSELFPESMAIRSFRDAAEYERLLCDRHVDQILYFHSYDARGTNEPKLIESLGLPVLARGPDFEALAVDRSRCPVIP